MRVFQPSRPSQGGSLPPSLVLHAHAEEESRDHEKRYIKAFSFLYCMPVTCILLRLLMHACWFGSSWCIRAAFVRGAHAWRINTEFTQKPALEPLSLFRFKVAEDKSARTKESRVLYMQSRRVHCLRIYGDVPRRFDQL